MVSKEQVNLWLNVGFNDLAVAGVGLSAESTNKLILTGEVPYHCPNPDMLPYQRELVKEGGFLYYTHPFIDNLSRHNPRLARRILRTVEGVENCLDEDRINDSLGYYALRNGVDDAYYEKLGVHRDSRFIVTMFASIFPTATRAYFNENPDLRKIITDWEFTEGDESGLETIEATLEDLRNLMDTCLRRRGVIVYYNEKVLEHKTLLNHEDEADLMILSKQPLRADVVSGIVPLSDTDRTVMLHGVE